MKHPDEIVKKIVDMLRDEGYFLNAIRLSWESTFDETCRPHVDYTPDQAPLLLNPQWYTEDEQN